MSITPFEQLMLYTDPNRLRQQQSHQAEKCTSSRVKFDILFRYPLRNWKIL